MSSEGELPPSRCSGGHLVRVAFKCCSRGPCVCSLRCSSLPLWQQLDTSIDKLSGQKKEEMLFSNSRGGHCQCCQNKRFMLLCQGQVSHSGLMRCSCMHAEGAGWAGPGQARSAPRCCVPGNATTVFADDGTEGLD